MPANDLAAFIRELRRKLDNEEIPATPFSLGPNPIDQVENLRWHAQMLIDEADVYLAMSKEEREQEPWASKRRLLAEEFRQLQRAMGRTG